MDGSDLAELVEERAVLLDNFDNSAHADHILELVGTNKARSTCIPACHTLRFKGELFLDVRKFNQGGLVVWQQNSQSIRLHLEDETFLHKVVEDHQVTWCINFLDCLSFLSCCQG